MLFFLGDPFLACNWISRDRNVPWPPLLPDLTVCDLLLWGFLKSRVYINKPCAIHKFYASIHNEIASILIDKLEQKMQSSSWTYF